MAGTPDPDAALELLAAHCDCVVIRRGARGALGIAGGVIRAVPADPVDVVDTTGAGDCFNAGFLAGWLSGLPIEAVAHARRHLRERRGDRLRRLPRMPARRGVPGDRGRARRRRAGVMGTRGGAGMKMTLLGAGVRAPFVLRGLAAGAADLDLDEVVLFDTDPERLELMTALGAHFAASWGAPFAVRGRALARRRARRRAVRVLRDPARPGGRARGRRGGAAQARRARPGDDGAGRVRDGAAHDPGDGRLRAADRGGRAERAAGELHEPGGDRDAGAARPHERARRSGSATDRSRCNAAWPRSWGCRASSSTPTTPG